MVPFFSTKLLRSFQKSSICPRVRGLAVVIGTPNAQNIRPYLITHGQYINFVLLPVFALQKKSNSTRNTFYITLVSKMSVHICGRFVFPPYAPINVMPAGGGGGGGGGRAWGGDLNFLKNFK